MNVEHVTFAPTRFTVFRGMGPENYKHHKHLTDKIDSKTDDNYGKVNNIHYKIAFIVICSKLLSGLCIGESSTLRKKNVTKLSDDIDLYHDELRI